MTNDAAFKKEIRARMRETGEKYTAARRALLAERAEREAANARAREAAMALMHIPVPGEPTLVACGEDRRPGMRLGTRTEVWDAGDAGCWACVDAWDEAGHIAADIAAGRAT